MLEPRSRRNFILMNSAIFHDAVYTWRHAVKVKVKVSVYIDASCMALVVCKNKEETEQHSN